MFIGVDVGGTKTEGMLVDAQGTVVAHVSAGAGNWEGIGLAAAARLYADIVAQLLESAALTTHHIHAHAWGLAGLDWPSDEQRLIPLIQPLIPHAPALVVNDAFLPLRAGSRFAYGVGVIAGTGSTVAGIGRNGTRYRTFGLGGLWGDYDGAMGLVVAAFRRMALAHHLRAPLTPLGELLCTWSGCASLPAFAEALSREELQVDLATFAPMVMQAATIGDPHACAAVDEAAHLLAQNAGAVASQLELCDSEFDVILAGGVAAGAPPVFGDTFRTKLHTVAPYAVVHTLSCRPVVGAVLLAVETVAPDAVRVIQQALVQKG